MFAYIIIFTCLWWIVFYITLPFGSEVTKTPKKGEDYGAPTKPRLGIKFIVTTLISLVITYFVVHGIESHQLRTLIEKYLSWLYIY